MADNAAVIPAPLSPVPPSPVLSEEQLRQLAVARVAVAKIRRAVGVAMVDGWTIAGFAILTLLLVVLGLGGMSGAAIGAVMGAIAIVELRGAAKLQRLEPHGARMLGYNQLVLAVLVIAYAFSSLHGELLGADNMAEIRALDPQMAQSFKSMAETARWVLFAGLIAVAVLVQGGLALYYFRRAGHIAVFIAQTPEWIVQLQKAGVTL